MLALARQVQRQIAWRREKPPPRTDEDGTASTSSASSGVSRWPMGSVFADSRANFQPGCVEKMRLLNGAAQHSPHPNESET